MLKCLGDACLLHGIPGSKEENLLFSFPGFLLSDCDKTQHPVVKVTDHIKSSGAGRLTLSQMERDFFP